MRQCIGRGRPAEFPEAAVKILEDLAKIASVAPSKDFARLCALLRESMARHFVKEVLARARGPLRIGNCVVCGMSAGPKDPDGSLPHVCLICAMKERKP